MRLMLLPLMRRQRPLLEVLREVAGLARTLPQAERDETMGAMAGLAYNYLEPTMRPRAIPACGGPRTLGSSQAGAPRRMKRRPVARSQWRAVPWSQGRLTAQEGARHDAAGFFGTPARRPGGGDPG